MPRDPEWARQPAGLFHKGRLAELREKGCLELHLWFLSRRHPTTGYVHGGIPLQGDRVARSAGLSLRVLRRQMAAWRGAGLGASTRQRRGMVVRVLRFWIGAPLDVPDVAHHNPPQMCQDWHISEVPDPAYLPGFRGASDGTSPAPPSSLLRTDRSGTVEKDPDPPDQLPADQPPGPGAIRGTGSPIDNGRNGRRGDQAPDMVVLRRFDLQHRRVLDNPYLCRFQKDRSLLRDPLRLYGLGRTLEMVDAFFREVERAQAGDPNAFTGRTKPDVGGFCRAIPNLIRDYNFTTPLPKGE